MPGPPGMFTAAWPSEHGKRSNPARGVCADDNCDGIDGEADNGVFVAKWGDDTNPGSREEPVQSIQRGIELAAISALRDVYVAEGVYAESVLLADGVGVYGGYGPRFAVRDPDVHESWVQGQMSNPALPGAVNCIGISGGAPASTAVDGFVIQGSHEIASEATSYAVYSFDCDDTLQIQGNRVIDGAGGDSASGRSPGRSGTDGLRGGDGLDAVDNGRGVARLGGDKGSRSGKRGQPAVSQRQSAGTARDRMEARRTARPRSSCSTRAGRCRRPLVDKLPNQETETGAQQRCHRRDRHQRDRLVPADENGAGARTRNAVSIPCTADGMESFTSATRIRPPATW